MTTTYKDHGAFPYNEDQQTKGLTKREYFAAMAMQGYLASYPGSATINKETVADFSVKMADELIKALNK